MSQLQSMPIWKRVRSMLGYLRFRLSFRGSAAYWDQRYQRGRSSGSGSYNRLAEFKAEFLNGFVAQHEIKTVIEFGCGDGNQLSLATYPAYFGLDVSSQAIELCKKRFAGDPTKQFSLLDAYRGTQAELALSLDVLYHLVEDGVFVEYMQRLFASATRFVVIYSSNTDENPRVRPPHVRHRYFTAWVTAYAPEWALEQVVPNRYPIGCDADTEAQSFADFYVYCRKA